MLFASLFTSDTEQIIRMTSKHLVCVAKHKPVYPIKPTSLQEDCLERHVKALTFNRCSRVKHQENRTLKNNGVNFRKCWCIHKKKDLR